MSATRVARRARDLRGRRMPLRAGVRLGATHERRDGAAMKTSMRYQETALPEETRSRNRRRRGDILVGAQFALLGLTLVPVGPRFPLGWAQVVGWGAVAAGAVVGSLALGKLGRATKVHPIPAAGAPLRTTGIYGVVRHPMYLAVLLLASGATLISGRLVALLATSALALVLVGKLRFEEEMLEEQFGWQYSVYANHVPALLPRPGRRRF